MLAVLNWAGKDRQAPGAHCPACLICLASPRLVKRQTVPEEEHSSVSSDPHMCVHTGTPAHRCTHTKEQGCKVTRPVIRMVRNQLHRWVSKPRSTESPPSWDQLQHEPQREQTRFHTYVLFSFLRVCVCVGGGYVYMRGWRREDDLGVFITLRDRVSR